ncbi:MAG: hypothetical protein JW793_08915 [Acidobacteria bacterium]|nr:hypothetical protein [Acidobacteriota bacterium]
MITETQLNDLKKDPVVFFAEVLRDPETGQPFELYGAERAFLREAFALLPDGRMKYPELVFAAPKKSGKTALGAGILIYATVVLGGLYAEAYVLANDLEQSMSRAFQAAARIIKTSPLLRDSADIYQSKIIFPSTGGEIRALASDYTGAAGANPTISVFDELWGYTSERSVRLWDEMVPPPTRKIACRLTVTYAGFEGESELLEKLYKRGLKGKEIAPDLYAQPGMLMFWTHECRAPWQTADWKLQMREQLRPNAYMRMIENRWVTTESTFIDMGWWDACVYDYEPLLEDRRQDVWIGVDASVKRDSTAIVCVTYDSDLEKVILVNHFVFQPTKAEPLDFESCVEDTLLDLNKRFHVREIRFDPYQLIAVSQRLQRKGLRMQEFPQTVPNLTEASSNLYDLLKNKNLVVYPDAGLRKSVGQAVAIETTRGWRIAKEKASHKIDVVVALAQAALAATKAFHTRPGDIHIS